MNIKVSNVNFGSVTPIIATSKAKKNLSQILKLSKNNYALTDATDLYKSNLKNPLAQKGILSEACEKGKKILFLITGDEYSKYIFMDRGWGSISAPSRHIDRVPVTLGDDSISKMIKLLKRTEIK